MTILPSGVFGEVFVADTGLIGIGNPIKEPKAIVPLTIGPDSF